MPAPLVTAAPLVAAPLVSDAAMVLPVAAMALAVLPAASLALAALLFATLALTPVAPAKFVTAAIATVLYDMGLELAALETSRNKTRDLKQAMMQELLTGKTRLVPAGGAHA